MKTEMIKNIAIGILAVLCLVLAGLNFGSGNSTGQSAGQGASLTDAAAGVSSAVTKDSKKLDPSAVIHMATIEGLSLLTKPEAVEEEAQKTGFTCTKAEPSAGQINWTCPHSSLAETTLTISATSGKIISISRNGAISLENVAPTMNTIEDLKFLLNTRKNVRFSQSEDAFSFSVRYDINTGSENLDYNIMKQRIFEPPEPGKPFPRPEDMKIKLVYSASLSVPAPPPEASATPAQITPAPATDIAAQTQPMDTPETDKKAEEEKPAEKDAPKAEADKKVEEEEPSEVTPAKETDAPKEKPE